MKALPRPLLDSRVFAATTRCRSIVSRGRQLRHLEFASRNPIRLVEAISNICSVLPNEFVNLRESFETDPVNVQLQLTLIDDLVRDLGAHLRYVEAAVPSRIPYSLAAPLEQFCKRFLPSTTLMLRAQWSYNYAIITPNLKDYYRRELENFLSAEVVDEALAPLPKDFHIVSFPAVERKTVLLHSALAHEIGHLVAKRFLTSDFKPNIPNLASKIRERLRKSQNDADFFAQAEAIDKAQNILRKGVFEIVADIFAALSLGPAAVLAMLDTAVADALDLLPSLSTSYYPPWRMRLRIAVDNLEKEDLLSIDQGDYEFDGRQETIDRVAGRFRQIQELVRDRSDEKVIDADWLVKTAYEEIVRTIPEAERHVRKEYGEHLVRSERLYRAVFPLVHRLATGITPNEIKTTHGCSIASVEQILNAAWFHRIATLDGKMSHAMPGDDIEEEYAALNRLTLRAIELAHIHQAYNAFQKGNTDTPGSADSL